MWPAYEHEEARVKALKQRLMKEAAAQNMLKHERLQHRRRRRRLLRMALYRIGGWLRRRGEALQRQYHEEPQAEEIVWLADFPEANGS